MKYKLLLISLLTCAISFSYQGVSGQFIDNGQNPPGLRWRQINTPHIQLIFPSTFDKEAWRMAGVLEKVYVFENRSLKVNTRPISVLLQNQQVQSNAFVLLAPRRSEFYTSPAQDMEPTDWLNSLAVHEMRHVVQEDKVFGGKHIQLFESVQLSLFGLVFPSWFFEGDAVGMETALTATGRGRLPSFEREYRANLLSGKNYSYSKSYLGSLNDNVPDYYRLGYFMVTKLRRDYGDSVFNKVYQHALRLNPWPLSTSLKRYTGYSTPAFFKATMEELKKTWAGQSALKQPEAYPVLDQRTSRVYSNYLLPRPYKGELLVLKTGLNMTDAFYLIDTLSHKESRLFKIGSQLVSHFDLQGDDLVWDEQRTDPRYAYRTYSVVLHYNMVTHKHRQLSFRSRLFAPSLSPDATQVLAVKTGQDNQFRLVLLNTTTGALTRELPNPENYFFQTPRFDRSGKKIICIAVNNRGKALYEYSLNDDTHRLVEPFSFTEISRPCYATGNLLLYSSTADGVDDLYSIDLQSGIKVQLTNSTYGAYAPFAENDRIYFNLFNVPGQDISCFSLKVQQGKELHTPSHFISYFQPLVKREAGGSIFTEQRKAPLPDAHPLADSLLIAESDTSGNKLKYQEKAYHEIDHFFYFHSLLPSVQGADLNSTDFLAGVKVLSTNKLNTTQTYAGVYYQNGYNSAVYQAGFSYKRFYPYLNTSFNDRKRNSEAVSKSKTGVITYIPFSYRESRYNLGLEVPLNFLIANQAWSVDAQVNTSYVHNYAPSIALSSFTRSLAFPLHYSLLIARNNLMAARDIYPLWGQNIDAEYEHLPFTTLQKGSVFYMNSFFYFPGLFIHHSLQIGYSYQQPQGLYQNDRLINEISGYAFLPPNKIRNNLILNYYLPLVYPDWQISSLAYIRKIQAGVFLNEQNLGRYADPLFKNYQTYGLDLRVDCNLLRYYLPVFQIGTRVIFFQRSLASPKFQLVLNYTI